MRTDIERTESVQAVVVLLACSHEDDSPVALWEIAGVPALTWAVRSIRASGTSSRAAILVVATSHPELLHAVLGASGDGEGVTVIFCAGAPRNQIYQALSHLQSVMGYGDESVVVVHDVARPLASPALIDRVVSACARAAGVPAIPVLAMTETIKELDGEGRIIATVPRDSLVRVQLPQASSLIRLRQYCVAADAVDSGDTLYLVEPLEAEFVAGDRSALPILNRAELEFASALARSLPELAD